jgi:hypothetical protein
MAVMEVSQPGPLIISRLMDKKVNLNILTPLEMVKVSNVPKINPRVKLRFPLGPGLKKNL